MHKGATAYAEKYVRRVSVGKSAFKQRAEVTAKGVKSAAIFVKNAANANPVLSCEFRFPFRTSGSALLRLEGPGNPEIATRRVE
jgi:hypothetical protein